MLNFLILISRPNYKFFFSWEVGVFTSPLHMFHPQAQTFSPLYSLSFSSKGLLLLQTNFKNQRASLNNLPITTPNIIIDLIQEAVL